MAETSEQASENRGASFGIVVAVISATLLWAGLIAVYVTFLY